MNFIMFYHFIYDISLICFISFILTIWFESDIVQTFAKITRTRNLFKLSEFEKYKLEEDVMCNYPNFLYTKYTGYFTKLISCPICLCFWSTLFLLSSLIFYIGYPAYYIIILFPINYIFSLMIYLILKKLI